MMKYLLCMVIGGALTLLFSYLYLRTGTLEITTKDPKKDSYLFKVEKFNRLLKRKFVLFKVTRK